MKRPFLLISLVVLLLVGILSTVFITQNRLEQRSRAEKTVTLSFSPTSTTGTPIQVKSGQTFSVDLLLNPGANLVSAAKIHVIYDPTKMQITSGIPFQQNESAFPQLLEASYTPGNIRFNVSIGSDQTKALTSQTKLGTITFKALDNVTTAEGPTLIEYGTDSTVSSISSGTTHTENVISNTVPATISIIEEATPPATTTTTSGTITQTLSVAIKCLVTKLQICQPMYVTSVDTSSVLKVNFKRSSAATDVTSNTNRGSITSIFNRNNNKNKKPTPTPKKKPQQASCSKYRVHLYVDGVKKYTSGWLLASSQTGTIDLGPVTSGTHILGIQAEGDAACGSWSGTVDVTTNSDTHIPPLPPTACKVKAPIDIMLVMDTSGSMNDRVSGSTRKLAAAKTAANKFVDILSADTNNKVGLVSYNYPSSTVLKSPLTNNFSNVKTQINALSAKGSTCIQCGVNKARQEFTANGRPGYKNAVILLTDGRANQIEGGPNRDGKTSIAELATITSVLTDFNANKTAYYTIGLGKNVNSTFLRLIANSTGGRYYYSPTGSDLNQIYEQISQIVSQGSISGYIYDDKNGNGAYDESIDTKLAGRQVQLLSQNTVVQTVTTDESGSFNVAGVCGGTYTLKQVLQSGWTQTQPSGSTPYTITITNSDPITNKNFGTKQAITPTATPTPTAIPTPTNEPTTEPTATTAPSATSIPTTTTVPSTTSVPTATTIPTALPSGPQTLVNVDALLHGIGKIGDNTNLNTYSLSNQNPLHTTQLASVSVYDANNNLVTSASGDVTYSSASGSFKGTINLGGTIATGVYTIKVKTERHLYRLVAGIQSLTAGQTNNLAQTDLVAGDVNDDNKLNILDYNGIINCYSDLSPAVACNPTLKLQTDLNDDGNVNQIDYNLFLREIATQPGQ